MKTSDVIGVGVMGAQTRMTDEELMVRYQAGDRSAFRALYRRHAAGLKRFMARGLLRGGDAEDLVQQTFFRLHSARTQFRSDARFRPWFNKIAINVKREYFRWWSRRHEATLELDGHTEPHARSADPDVMLILGRACRALQSLPRTQREAIELRAQGFTFAEAAERTGESVVCMKMRMRRGALRMRHAV